jgi:hypothetical protein
MMKKQSLLKPVSVVTALAILAGLVAGMALLGAGLPGGSFQAAAHDSLVFIHHSVGNNWLNSGLQEALLAKDYIGQRNDIYYGVDLAPDAGRPASLEYPAGNYTDMNHWLLWFNDYLGGVESHSTAYGLNKLIARLSEYVGVAATQGRAGSFNRIVMFKSCYPNSDIGTDGMAPGDPFDSHFSLANYQAVYHHADSPGHTYTYHGATYQPLEDIFAENPDVLFIVITAPPLHYAPADATTDANAHRARVFNNWLQNEWLASYRAAHPGLNNVVVFDLFDVLAYADDHPSHPNRLKAEYGGESGDSHPNDVANAYLTQIFATNQDNFLDGAWRAFSEGQAGGQTSP